MNTGKIYQRSTTDLSKYDNSWYKQPPLLKNVLWFVANALFLNSYLLIPVSFKRFILRAFGAKMGKGVMIKPKVNIKYPWLLSIGNDVWIGEEVWIDNLTEVSLGNNVCLSQGAMLLTGNHDYTRSTFDLSVGKIVIEEGVWIGAKAIVCPNVICHSHAVLAVHSVAVKNLEAYGIYQGNPAQWIRERKIEA
ncbi:WcaF family extracellular polysaccharide biosynthesis acetyltransferase [Runella slithyformis]|uniref:Colanic acid biosynthesis acetyltransferase WcaF n=1 Tax=Runella slithyformis (strain ATCC 29530 / DSM 19594 / LMG 11500 / NCIMB 11436 / LSU 4) TaxID=761193 RepID=A0A7U3ZKW4_RUNSL|nr:WcaF family extracellular polysaccharide biosynthesis acetyltransferase [Runella slithyformis]AEI49056.1 colanic acid biosynthesis acetyltransferase WcaF [Runella slithyformis DSM 19594]